MLMCTFLNEIIQKIISLVVTFVHAVLGNDIFHYSAVDFVCTLSGPFLFWCPIPVRSVNRSHKERQPQIILLIGMRY